MLSLIRVRNFKFFKDEIQIPVGQINLLTGINGGGKSTVLQALLLMHQSLVHSPTTDRLIFNGRCVELGNFDDVRNSDTSRSEDIEMMFRFQDGSEFIDTCYFFGEDEADEMSAQIHRAEFVWHLTEGKRKLEVENSNDGFALLPSENSEGSVTWRNFFIDEIHYRSRQSTSTQWPK